MGKVTGFLEYERLQEAAEPKEQRVQHYREFVAHLTDKEASIQGARCMDCGIPFCMTGCPVNNIIPDWNDLVYKQNWRQALDTLHSTNNFPEFTGRVCPAPCEEACTLNINNDPVGIKSIEHAIIDKGCETGWVVPQPPARKTGKRVAVVGSGPAGLAAAQQLARAGHAVVLFEKNDRIGGLLRYGIPDFKMEKWLIDRRMEQLAAEGVEFRTGVCVGTQKDLAAGVNNLAKEFVPVKQLADEFDAVVLSGGAEHPRDLPVPGRELDGIHFAMEFLPLQNRRVAGDDGIARPVGHRQARGRDRRRRHRLRLRRYLQPSRRQVRHPVRAAAARRRRSRRAIRSGPTGRRSCAPPPRTKKARTATGPLPPSCSRARTARSRRWLRCGSSGRRIRPPAR